MLIFYLLITAYVLHWYWETRRKSGEPPILSGSVPFLGHAYMIAGGTVKLWDRFKTITYETMRNGDATYFLLGTQKLYVLTDPDDIHLVSNTCLQKDTMVGELSKELLGGGLVFADVATWKRHRKLILPTFNQQILDSFIITFNNQAKQLVKKFTKESGKGAFDHTVYVRQIALRTIALTAMGTDINENEVHKYIQAYETALGNGLERYQKFWFHFDYIYNKSALKRQQDYCVRTVRDMAEKIWKSGQEIFKKSIENEDTKLNEYSDLRTETKPFLEHLLYKNNMITEHEIKDEINNMLIAGSDTSSNVIIFALVIIGSHPKVQENIYSELKDVFSDFDGDVKKEDLSKLVYLEAVLKETMRYYVLAPFIIRYLDKEIKLKNCTLRPGNNCFLSLYGVYRHPFWGDAEEFRPERWFENTLPSNPNVYVAFSIGKRNCIGRSYAMMSMKIALCHLFQRFKIHADYTKLKIKLDVIIKPASGYFISIENR